MFRMRERVPRGTQKAREEGLNLAAAEKKVTKTATCANYVHLFTLFVIFWKK